MSNRFSNRIYGASAAISRMRKTWRFASLCLVLLTGVAAVGLAGCGGGGGGSIITLPNVTVTFQLVNNLGAPADGTVVINGESIASVATRVVKSLQPGNYAVTFTVNGITTTVNITVGADAGQTYVLTAGVTGAPGQGITISGRLLNANTVDDTCDNAAPGFFATIQIRVRRQMLDGTTPIVASIVKPGQEDLPATDQGRFVISNIPSPGATPATYFVEVRPLPDQQTPYSGTSASFSLSDSGTAPTALTVCVKDNAVPQ